MRKPPIRPGDKTTLVTEEFYTVVSPDESDFSIRYCGSSPHAFIIESCKGHTAHLHKDGDDYRQDVFGRRLKEIKVRGVCFEVGNMTHETVEFRYVPRSTELSKKA